MSMPSIPLNKNLRRRAKRQLFIESLEARNLLAAVSSFNQATGEFRIDVTEQLLVQTVTRVDSDFDGGQFLTINDELPVDAEGNPLRVTTDDIRKLRVVGTVNNDDIDLFAVSAISFRNLEEVRIFPGGAGLGSRGDIVIGSQLNDIISVARGVRSIDGNAGEDTLRVLYNSLSQTDATLLADSVVVNGQGLGRNKETEFSEMEAARFLIDDLASENGGPLNLDASRFPGKLHVAATLFGDTILGGAGDDTIFGDDGSDMIVGGAGDDSIVGGFGDDTLEGGDGQDDLSGGEDRDSLFGGDDEDKLFGSESGGSFPTHTPISTGDLLDGGSGNDTLEGSPGRDTLIGGDGSDQLFGGLGDDTYRFPEVFGGSFETDSVSEFIERLSQTITPQIGGLDTLDFSGTEFGIETDLTNPAMPLLKTVQREIVLTSVGDGDHFETILGTKDDDELTAFGQAGMRLEGREGNDTLTASSPGSQLDGGVGNDEFVFLTPGETVSEPHTVTDATGDLDTLNFSGLGEPVVVDLTGGPSDVLLAVLPDRTSQPIVRSELNLAGFEKVVGTPFDDEIQGTGGAQTLVGGLGNDLILGGNGPGADLLIGDLEDEESAEGGRDVLAGSRGSDTLLGGPGNDYLLGDDGRNQLVGGGGEDIFADLKPTDRSDAKVDRSVDFEVFPTSVKPNDTVSYKFTIQNTGAAQDAIFGPSLTVDMVNIDASFTKNTGFPFPEALYPHLPDAFPRQNVLFRNQTKEETATGKAGKPGIGSTTASVTIREPDDVGDNDQVKKDIDIGSRGVFARRFGLLGGARQFIGHFFGGVIRAANGVVVAANAGGTSSATATTGDRPSKLPFNRREAITEGGEALFLGQGFLDPFAGGGLNLAVHFGDPVRVDVTENGVGGEQDASNAVITPDGRFAAFSTRSTIISPVPDRNIATDIYWKDLLTGELKLVSINNEETSAGNDGSNQPLAISPDGRFVAFISGARDLIEGYTRNASGGGRDLFLRDVETGSTKLVSLSLSDTGPRSKGANGGSNTPVFSADGRFLVFSSGATDLVEGYVPPEGNSGDFYVYDLVSQETQLVSAAADGVTGSNFRHAFASPTVGVTADRLRIAFATTATNLQSELPDDERTRVLLREYTRDSESGNLQGGVTHVVSVNADRTEVRNGDDPTLTPDGRFLVFNSDDPDLTDLVHSNATNQDVFLKDLETGVTELITVNLEGTDAGDRSTFASADLSDDGRFVTFSTQATDVADFVKTDRFVPDVFVRDRLRGETTLLSLNAGGTASGNDGSTRPTISGDGTTVAFDSEATDLIEGIDDRNGNGTDVFFSGRHLQPLVFLSESDDTVVARRNGELLELFSSSRDTVIFSRDLNDMIGLVVNGSDTANETLIVDYNSGTFDLELGIVFNAGSGSDDQLILRNGSFQQVTYQAAGVDAGYVQLRNGSDESITYTGVESIDDETSAAERLFQTFLGDIVTEQPVDARIRLLDDEVTNNEMVRIDDGHTDQFVSHRFASPNLSLTLEGGFGDDVLLVESLDHLFGASLLLRGLFGDDRLDSSSHSRSVRQEGGPGDDILVAGSGNDELDGGLGADELNAGGGDDRLHDPDDGATLVGGSGVDVVLPRQFGTLDFTVGLGGSMELDHIEARGQGANHVVVDLAAVRAITGPDNTLLVFAELELDTIDLGGGFQNSGTEVAGGLSFTVFQQEDATVKITFDEGVFNLKPWSNPQVLLDVNGDGLVTAVGDVLPTINELNTAQFIDETGRLPVPPPISPPPFFFDTNEDGFLTAVGDVLPLINFINQNPGGEGESSEFANDLPLLATKAAGWYAGKTAAATVDSFFAKLGEYGRSGLGHLLRWKPDLPAQVALVRDAQAKPQVGQAVELSSERVCLPPGTPVANGFLEACKAVVDEPLLAEELDRWYTTRQAEFG